MKRSDTDAMAASARALLAAIDAGELVTDSATRHRLEGALAALEAVLGVPADRSSLLDRLGVESK